MAIITYEIFNINNDGTINIVDNNTDKGNNNNTRKNDDENGKSDEVEVELISSPFNVSPKGNKVINNNCFSYSSKRYSQTKYAADMFHQCRTAASWINYKKIMYGYDCFTNDESGGNKLMAG